MQLSIVIIAGAGAQTGQPGYDPRHKELFL
jgi:hypothetical protein